MQAPFFGAFHALAIDDTGGGTGLPADLLSTLHIKGVMDLAQRPVVLPTLEIPVHGAPGRRVLGDIAPLVSSAQHIHHAVQHFANVDFPPSPTPFRGRYPGLDPGPFFVGQVAWIAKAVPVVSGAVFCGPHVAPRESVPFIESRKFRRGNPLR